MQLVAHMPGVMDGDDDLETTIVVDEFELAAAIAGKRSIAPKLASAARHALPSSSQPRIAIGVVQGMRRRTPGGLP